MTSLILPGWAVAVLASLFVTVLGAAWSVASRASRSADQLDAATQRLAGLEARIAVISTLETALAVLGVRVGSLTDEVNTLRSRSHAQGSEITALTGAVTATRQTAERAADDVRRITQPPHGTHA